jgi:mitosis inhibitor protein kinase SWE1
MVSTYSPHRDAGGTLHLHSPTHIHHMDASSAIRELRRSLSRSPSKLVDYRNYSSRSHSPSAMNVPFSPSPLSPSRRSTSDNTLQIPSPSLTPSHAIPYPPSARASRPTLRRSVQSQNLSRSTRTSPKSPSKRPLADLSNGGNAPPMSLRKRSSTDAQCEYPCDTFSLVVDKENEDGLDFIAAPKMTTSRAEKRLSENFGSKATAASPMKRNEGSMAMERASFGSSPSAKRRSLHGPSSDFNIFESDLQGGELERRSLDEIDWSPRYGLPSMNTYFNTIPKRSSSLRKSTLQQRQFERPTNSKSSSTVNSTAATPGLHNQKKGQRCSLDNHLPPMQRDSPFSSQGSLLSASIHPVGQVSYQGQNQSHSQVSQISHPPHPLSRTMTQSSSASSIADESPTHEPIRRPDRPKSMFDFSKSLPIGSSRPTDLAEEETQGSSQDSFATPATYKSAKPLPAAFMSTGLISKKNRNVDDPHGGLPKAHMPDTPCKKQVIPFPAASNFAPAGAPKVARPARHSFGTPSTPLNSHHSVIKPAPFTFGKGVGIFGANGSKNGLNKKASFASIEGEEYSQSQSPNARDSQTSTETDYPPTPTKRVLSEYQCTSRPSSSRSGDKFRLSSSFSSKPVTTSRLASSKLSPIGASPGSVDGDSDSVMEDSPSASLRPSSTLSVISAPSSSFTRGRLLRNLNSPTPLSRKALTIPSFGPSPRSGRTKLDCLSPVSPKPEISQRSSPHTPQEHLLPPDPSGLSISGHSERPLLRRGNSSASGMPATPTGPRDYFKNITNGQSLNLTAVDATDVDLCLVSKFDRVELVGTGEFSQVYRVTAAPNTSPYQPSPYHSLFSHSTPRSSSESSHPERVFAVKKTRHAYSGARDRQRKLHEVDVLKALGNSDHVLSFVESWEDQGHLYIQTEFCEEGTLDIFLARVGIKARLDDFRIWKLLLELSLVCIAQPRSWCVTDMI